MVSQLNLTDVKFQFDTFETTKCIALYNVIVWRHNTPCLICWIFAFEHFWHSITYILTRRHTYIHICYYVWNFELDSTILYPSFWSLIACYKRAFNLFIYLRRLVLITLTLCLMSNHIHHSLYTQIFILTYVCTYIYIHTLFYYYYFFLIIYLSIYRITFSSTRPDCKGKKKEFFENSKAKKKEKGKTTHALFISTLYWIVYMYICTYVHAYICSYVFIHFFFPFNIKSIFYFCITSTSFFT